MAEKLNRCGYLRFFKKDGSEGSVYQLNENGKCTIGTDVQATIRIKFGVGQLKPIQCIVDVGSDGTAKLINTYRDTPIKLNNKYLSGFKYLLPGDTFMVSGKQIRYENSFSTKQVQNLTAKNNKLIGVACMKRRSLILKDNRRKHSCGLKQNAKQSSNLKSVMRMPRRSSCRLPKFELEDVSNSLILPSRSPDDRITNKHQFIVTPVSEHILIGDKVSDEETSCSGSNNRKSFKSCSSESKKKVKSLSATNKTTSPFSVRPRILKSMPFVDAFDFQDDFFDSKNDSVNMSFSNASTSSKNDTCEANNSGSGTKTNVKENISICKNTDQESVYNDGQASSSECVDIKSECQSGSETEDSYLNNFELEKSVYNSKNCTPNRKLIDGHKSIGLETSPTTSSDSANEFDSPDKLSSPIVKSNKSESSNVSQNSEDESDEYLDEDETHLLTTTPKRKSITEVERKSRQSRKAKVPVCQTTDQETTDCNKSDSSNISKGSEDKSDEYLDEDDKHLLNRTPKVNAILQEKSMTDVKRKCLQSRKASLPICQATHQENSNCQLSSFNVTSNKSDSSNISKGSEDKSDEYLDEEETYLLNRTPKSNAILQGISMTEVKRKCNQSRKASLPICPATHQENSDYQLSSFNVTSNKSDSSNISKGSEDKSDEYLDEDDKHLLNRTPKVNAILQGKSMTEVKRKCIQSRKASLPICQATHQENSDYQLPSFNVTSNKSDSSNISKGSEDKSDEYLDEEETHLLNRTPKSDAVLQAKSITEVKNKRRPSINASLPSYQVTDQDTVNFSDQLSITRGACNKSDSSIVPKDNDDKSDEYINQDETHLVTATPKFNVVQRESVTEVKRKNGRSRKTSLSVCQVTDQETSNYHLSSPRVTSNKSDTSNISNGSEDKSNDYLDDEETHLLNKTPKCNIVLQGKPITEVKNKRRQSRKASICQVPNEETANVADQLSSTRVTCNKSDSSDNEYKSDEYLDGDATHLSTATPKFNVVQGESVTEGKRKSRQSRSHINIFSDQLSSIKVASNDNDSSDVPNDNEDESDHISSPDHANSNYSSSVSSHESYNYDSDSEPETPSPKTNISVNSKCGNIKSNISSSALPSKHHEMSLGYSDSINKTPHIHERKSMIDLNKEKIKTKAKRSLPVQGTIDQKKMYKSFHGFSKDEFDNQNQFFTPKGVKVKSENRNSYLINKCKKSEDFVNSGDEALIFTSVPKTYNRRTKSVIQLDKKQNEIVRNSWPLSRFRDKENDPTSTSNIKHLSIMKQTNNKNMNGSTSQQSTSFDLLNHDNECSRRESLNIETPSEKSNYTKAKSMTEPLENQNQNIKIISDQHIDENNMLGSSNALLDTSDLTKPTVSNSLKIDTETPTSVMRFAKKQNENSFCLQPMDERITPRFSASFDTSYLKKSPLSTSNKINDEMTSTQILSPNTDSDKVKCAKESQRMYLKIHNKSNISAQILTSPLANSSVLNSPLTARNSDINTFDSLLNKKPVRTYFKSSVSPVKVYPERNFEATEIFVRPDTEDWVQKHHVGTTKTDSSHVFRNTLVTSMSIDDKMKSSQNESEVIKASNSYEVPRTRLRRKTKVNTVKDKKINVSYDTNDANNLGQINKKAKMPKNRNKKAILREQNLDVVETEKDIRTQTTLGTRQSSLISEESTVPDLTIQNNQNRKKRAGRDIKADLKPDSEGNKQSKNEQTTSQKQTIDESLHTENTVPYKSNIRNSMIRQTRSRKKKQMENLKVDNETTKEQKPIVSLNSEQNVQQKNTRGKKKAKCDILETGNENINSENVDMKNKKISEELTISLDKSSTQNNLKRTTRGRKHVEIKNEDSIKVDDQIILEERKTSESMNSKHSVPQRKTRGRKKILGLVIDNDEKPTSGDVKTTTNRKKAIDDEINNLSKNKDISEETNNNLKKSTRGRKKKQVEIINEDSLHIEITNESKNKETSEESKTSHDESSTQNKSNRPRRGRKKKQVDSLIVDDEIILEERKATESVNNKQNVQQRKTRGQKTTNSVNLEVDKEMSNNNEQSTSDGVKTARNKKKVVFSEEVHEISNMNDENITIKPRRKQQKLADININAEENSNGNLVEENTNSVRKSNRKRQTSRRLSTEEYVVDTKAIQKQTKRKVTESESLSNEDTVQCRRSKRTKK